MPTDIDSTQDSYYFDLYTLVVFRTLSLSFSFYLDVAGYTCYQFVAHWAMEGSIGRQQQILLVTFEQSCTEQILFILVCGLLA